MFLRGRTSVGNHLNAQPDLDKNMQLLSEADKKHADDLAGPGAGQGPTGHPIRVPSTRTPPRSTWADPAGPAALLSASSPSMLIHSSDAAGDGRPDGRAVAGTPQGQRQGAGCRGGLGTIGGRCAKAVDEAAAFRADLQNKRAELREPIGHGQRQLLLLAAQQAGSPCRPRPSRKRRWGPIAPIPTVGMAGIVPNADSRGLHHGHLPGVQSIRGVRADALPDHPSGHALGHHDRLGHGSG